MKRPRICAVITDNDIKSIKKVEPLADLFEVRIDLIGESWQEVVRQLKKPWIACNRSVEEGGKGEKIETLRIEKLLKAIELGAAIIDIELRTERLAQIMPVIGKRAKRLLSFHDFTGTPDLEEMRGLVRKQINAGADICKVVTTAQKFDDNLAVLQLIAEFPVLRIVAFAMGERGLLSRIFCPMAGGDFTYAAIEVGKESAAGQITVKDLRNLYEMVRNGN